MFINWIMCIYVQSDSSCFLVFLLCSSCVPPISYDFTVLQGLKARNFIHSKIEENIKKKVQESDKETKHRDALQQLIDSSKKNGEPFSMQVVT